MRVWPRPAPRGPSRAPRDTRTAVGESAEPDDLTRVEQVGIGQDGGVGAVQGLPSAGHTVRVGDREQRVTGGDGVGTGVRARVRARRGCRRGAGCGRGGVALGGALPPAGVGAGPGGPALPGQGPLRDGDLLLTGGQVSAGRVLLPTERGPGGLGELQAAEVPVAGVDRPVAAAFAVGHRIPGRVGRGGRRPGQPDSGRPGHDADGGTAERPGTRPGRRPVRPGGVRTSHVRVP